eukprot:988853-Amphidinium_carterae.4
MLPHQEVLEEEAYQLHMCSNAFTSHDAPPPTSALSIAALSIKSRIEPHITSQTCHIEVGVPSVSGQRQEETTTKESSKPKQSLRWTMRTSEVMMNAQCGHSSVIVT